MGNSCCKESDEIDDPIPTDGMHVIQTEDLQQYSSNPEAKMKEYMQMIRDTQFYNLAKLRVDLRENTHTFILNNLVLSIQFFKNFSRDKETIRERKMDKEKQTNGQLYDVRRRCLYEGSLTEFLGENVTYSNKGKSPNEMVNQLKFTILHENFEVYPEEAYLSLLHKEYSAVDGTIYRFCMENADGLPGYAMLRCVDIPVRKRRKEIRQGSASYDEVGNESDGYSKFSDYGSLKLSITRNSSSTTDVSETSAPDDQDTKQNSKSNEDKDSSTPPPAIANRPKLETPTKLSDEEDHYNDGKEMMEKLIEHIYNAENGKFVSKKLQEPTTETTRGALRESTSTRLGTRAVGQKRFISKNQNIVKKVAQKKRPVIRRSSTSGLPTTIEESENGDSKPRRDSGVDRELPGLGRRRDSGVLPSNIQHGPVVTDILSLLPKPEENKRRRQNRLAISSSLPNLTSPDTSSDDDYDYIDTGSIPRPLRRRKNSRPSDSSLPSDCFQPVQIKLVENDGSNPLEIGCEYEERIYLSSTGFMQNFSDAFCDWGKRFNINMEIDKAEVVRAGIRYKEIRQDPPPGQLVQMEFVPAIPIPNWPDIATEWRIRKRSAVRDKRTNIRYSWPRANQIETIAEQGCHLIATGGRIRGRSAPNSDLQWQFSFGNAEVSLLSSLSHSHIRCLIWAYLIHRHILAPLNVISTYHIETIFFWLVERNYLDWPEEFLGERLFLIFQELYFAFRKGKLSHYFVRKSNLLLTKRKDLVLKAHEKLFRLQEHFLPLVMHTARRIHVNHSSYPLPDLSRLWEILTSEVTLLSINPALRETLLTNPTNKENRPEKTKRKDDDHPFSRDREDKTRDLLRRERARIEAQKREKERENRQSTVSVNSMNLETPIKRFDLPRTKLLLIFFIQHFIQMAKMANKNRFYEESFVLTNHAENLATLLMEIGFEDEAGQFKETINALQQASHPGGFTEEYVHIPGSPSVFYTGVTKTNTARQRDSPLPDLPKMMVNGGTKSNSKVNLSNSKNNTSPSPKTVSTPVNNQNHQSTKTSDATQNEITVQVTIEQTRSDSTSTIESSDSSGHSFRNTKRGVLFISDNEQEESTDL